MTTTSGITVNVYGPSGALAQMPEEVVDAARARYAKRDRYARRVDAHRQDHRHGIRAEVPVNKGEGSTAVLRLYDPIDSWGEMFGVSAKEFASALDELDDDIETIELRINSPGGEVFEGIAILNLLRSHPARVVAVVEGLAASAASFVAAGADEVIMSRNAEMMIHDAWGLCVGNAADMRSLADDLERLSTNIATIYAEKAGGDLADWQALMAAETWFTADEAVEHGLADRVDRDDDAQPSNRHDLTIFNFAGRTHAPDPKIPADTPVVGSTTAQGGSAVAFSDEQLTDLRQKLDVDADADEATILDAVDTLLEQATAPSGTDTNDDPEIPEGVALVDQAQLDQLRADAEAGRAALARQQEDDRAKLVDSAIHDGRIAPAQRDAWVAKLAADDGSDKVLASLTPGVIPVTAKGDGGHADLDSEFTEYDAIYGKEATV